MKFHEFIKIEELQGAFGDVKLGTGIGDIQKQIKSVVPVRNKGTSVGRMMAAGKVLSPARPAGLTTPNKPMTIPSLLN